MPFGQPIRVTIPPELADEAALLAYLDLGLAELKKIWYYRGRMYQHFSIAKGRNGARIISAPNKRLKFLQRKLADKLTELYRPRDPVHGFVAKRSIKTEETAQVFGVPFELIPFKVGPEGPQPPQPDPNHIYSVPEKVEYEITFPIVTGYH